MVAYKSKTSHVLLIVEIYTLYDENLLYYCL
jgi:hypothetical protein